MLDLNFFLHSLVVYTIVGSGLVLGVFLLAFKFCKIHDHITKRNFLLLAMAIPLLVTLYNYFIWPVLTRQLGPKCVSSFFANLCPLGKWGAQYYLPLLFLIAIGSYRGLMHYGYHRRLSRWTLGIEEDCYQRPLDTLKALCSKADMTIPEVRIINKPSYECFAYGLLRPTIVISQSLLLALNNDELAGVLAHELGHIYNRDNFWREIGAIFRDLGFYMPFVHWSLTILQNEQELAADDFAINLTEKPLVYGTTLIKVWRKNRELGKSLPATTAFVGKAKISERVSQALYYERVQSSATTLLLPVMGVVIILLLSYAC